MAKNFNDLDVNPVYKEMETATTDNQQPTKKPRKERKTYCKLEAEESKNALKTSGRKGLKLPRINLAFTPNNYEYIKTMSQVRGQNLTQFVNDIIDRSRNENKETYYKALEFREALNREMQERQENSDT
ncbi:MAG: hypothetical protein K6F00_07275 [Lachnospiraceae bacterium]|nr:hypothetical protein [Lachnospiraceae bacterium]